MRFTHFSKDFTEESFSRLIDELNTGLRKLAIRENLETSISRVENIAGNAEFEVEHGLKVTPKYRIILRQVGGGYITDTDVNWNEGSASFKNNGATAINELIIAFFRG